MCGLASSLPSHGRAHGCTGGYSLLLWQLLPSLQLPADVQRAFNPPYIHWPCPPTPLPSHGVCVSGPTTSYNLTPSAIHSCSSALLAVCCIRGFDHTLRLLRAQSICIGPFITKVSSSCLKVWAITGSRRVASMGLARCPIGTHATFPRIWP